MRTETQRQRDRDVTIASGPENEEVQLGQRSRDSTASKVQSVKERGFSVEFREAVNPDEFSIQRNIYFANRIKRGTGRRDGSMQGSSYLSLYKSRAAQYEENIIKIILCISTNPLPIC